MKKKYSRIFANNLLLTNSKKIQNLNISQNNKKMLEQLKEFDSISFALDGVLLDEFDGTENTLKKEMQELCSALTKLGKKVFILTRRFDGSQRKLSIENIKESELDFCIQNLNVEVIFTNRNSFYPYITNSDKHCHIDSSLYELRQMKISKSKITTFNINELKLNYEPTN